MTGTNPRDKIMPKDGDDGYFPTTGNELVSFCLLLNLILLESFLLSENLTCAETRSCCF